MGISAFIVEDSPAIREALVETLAELAGIRTVGTATSERAAKDWLANPPHAWDLAIVDLLLAEGSGFTLLTRCKKDAEGSGSVVVFSDFVSPAVQQRCKKLGADGVISKAHFPQLRSFLQSFLGRRQSAQAA